MNKIVKKYKMLKYFFFFLAMSFVIFGHNPAWAQLRPNSSGTDSKGPIAVSADNLEADDPQGLVTFKGNVVARQGDMTITCDVMKIRYTKDIPPLKPENAADEKQAEPAGKTAALNPASPAEGRQIERVECEGNVKITEGDRLAVGETALYLAQALPRRIVLTGNARVWQGKDSVTGRQVTYYLDDGRSLVEGRERERVRAIYNQNDDKAPKKSGGGK